MVPIGSATSANILQTDEFHRSYFLRTDVASDTSSFVSISKVPSCHLSA